MLPNDVSICTHFFPPGERLTKANNRMMGPPGRRCAAGAESQAAGRTKGDFPLPQLRKSQRKLLSCQSGGRMLPWEQLPAPAESGGPRGLWWKRWPRDAPFRSGECCSRKNVPRMQTPDNILYLQQKKNLTSCNPSVNKIYLEPHHSSTASCVKWEQISNLLEVVM